MESGFSLVMGWLEEAQDGTRLRTAQVLIVSSQALSWHGRAAAPSPLGQPQNWASSIKLSELPAHDRIPDTPWLPRNSWTSGGAGHLDFVARGIS